LILMNTMKAELDEQKQGFATGEMG
jgi:hypothetical protein